MGSVVKSIMGGGDGPSAGGEGGVTDLAGGLQAEGNEILGGLGANSAARVKSANDFAQALADQAAGKAPSIAEAQMRQSQDHNLQQQMALARSNRAVNPALAQRQVQSMAGQAARQTNQDAAIARLQERNQAQGQFGNFLGQQYQLAAQSRAAALGGAQAAANIDAANQARGDRMFGTLLNLGSSAAAGGATGGAGGKYKGGLIKGYANGGSVQKSSLQKSFEQMGGPGRILDIAHGESYGNEMDVPDVSGLMGNARPDEPTIVAGGPMDNSGQMATEMPMYASSGAVVPGAPVVHGDSPKNDVVHAMLSPGEMVIKRSVVEQGPKAISKFAEAVLKREAKLPKLHKGGLVSGFGGVLAAKNEYEQKMKQLDSKFKK